MPKKPLKIRTLSMNGVQEAESSNLSTQTTKSLENIVFSGLFIVLIIDCLLPEISPKHPKMA